MPQSSLLFPRYLMHVGFECGPCTISFWCYISYVWSTSCRSNLWIGVSLGLNKGYPSNLMGHHHSSIKTSQIEGMYVPFSDIVRHTIYSIGVPLDRWCVNRTMLFPYGAEDLRSLELDLLNSQGAWEYLGNFLWMLGDVVKTTVTIDG